MQSDRTQNIQQWIEDTGYLVNPTPTVLREIANTATAGDGTVNLLVNPTTFRAIDREFTVASRLAQLQEDDVLSFRTREGNFQTNLIVTESVTGAFIDLEELTAAVGSDDDDLIEQAMPLAEELWESGSQTHFRTPARDAVEETFSDWFPDEVYAAFVDAVSVMEDAARSDVSRDVSPFPDRRHTYAALLVAGAFTECSLRELGRCAEYSEIASRSTLSRVKQTLEDEGYVTTTPMETDVGRPPMRLKRAGLHSGDDIELLAERVYDDLDAESAETEETAE